MTKHMTKEELREDRVVTAASQAVDYARSHSRTVIAIAAALVVGIVATALIVNGRARAHREAGAAMFQAENLYFSGSFEQAATQLQAIADRYGSTVSGKRARLLAANAHLNSGNPGAAEQLFRKAAGEYASDPIAAAAVRRGLGGALAGQEKWAEAGAAFEEAATSEGNALAADDWLQAGRAYQRAGNREKSVQAFRTILEQHSSSAAAQEARVRLEEARAS